MSAKRARAGAALLLLLLLGAAASVVTAIGDSAPSGWDVADVGKSGDWAILPAGLDGDAMLTVGPEPAPGLPPLPPPPTAVGLSGDGGAAFPESRRAPPAEPADYTWLAQELNEAGKEERYLSSEWQYDWEVDSGAAAQHEVVTTAELPKPAAPMLQELLSDAQELATDTTEAQQAAWSGDSAGAEVAMPPVEVPKVSMKLPGGWTAELIYSRNESTYGIFNRPSAAANSTEHGAFDIRVGWSAKRRFIVLPANGSRVAAMQELIQREFYFSVSGVALMCLAAVVALSMVWKCLAEYPEEESDEEEEEEGQAEKGVGSDERVTFIKVIQESGYEKL